MPYFGPAASALAPRRILTPLSPEFGAIYDHIRAVATSSGLNVSGAWFAADKPVALKFRLWQPETVYQLGWWNGSGTMTDSVDMGIYDTAWAAKVRTGGTARSGVSAPQFVDVADTLLAPGDYYVAMSSNGTTANNSSAFAGAANAVMLGMEGLQDSATSAYTLPDPLTNMAAAATATATPFFMIALRSLV